MRAMSIGNLLYNNSREFSINIKTNSLQKTNFVNVLCQRAEYSMGVARKTLPPKRKFAPLKSNANPAGPLFNHNNTTPNKNEYADKPKKNKKVKQQPQPEEEKPQKTPEQIAKIKERLKKRRKSQKFKINDRIPENLETIAPKNLKNFYKKQPIGYERVDKLLGNCKFTSRKLMHKWMTRNNVTIKVGEEIAEDNSVREILQRAQPSDLTLLKYIRINGKPIPETVLPFFFIFISLFNFIYGLFFNIKFIKLFLLFI